MSTGEGERERERERGGKIMNPDGGSIKVFQCPGESRYTLQRCSKGCMSIFITVNITITYSANTRCRPGNSEKINPYH